MPKLAANISMMFTEWDFLDRFQAAADNGFAGVEFMSPYEHAADAVAKALGIEVPPAEELDGAGLSDRLWAVIHGLARLQIYLLDTEHLDDRSLYRQLEEQVLREEVREVPPEPGVREYIDLGPRPDSTADSRSEGGSGRSMPGQGRDALLPRPPA